MTIGARQASAIYPAAIAAGAALAIGAALYFQHALGYVPCALCLWQRWAYYLGIPLALALTALALREGPPRRILIAGLLLLMAIFVANAALGLYHAGIEWSFWPGPSACSSGAQGPSSGNFMQDLRATRIVPCDAAPWRFLGLSFAGWNMAISAALALVAARGAGRGMRAQGSSSVSQYR